MTTNYHTPIATGAAANAATFNSPLSQLDNALSDLLSGSQAFNNLSFNAASTLTIDNGSITPNSSLHLVSSETGTSDVLDTITPLNNTIMFLKATNGHTIRLTNSDNINANNVILTGNDILGLFCQNNQWSILNQAVSAKFSNRLFVSGLEVFASDSTNTANIQAGVCVSDNNRVVMSLPSGATVTMSASGIGGLDTGSVANNTFYYIWVCSGPSGTGAVASASFTNPTLPAGYNLYKRLIGCVRTDGSATVRSQLMVRGDNGARRVYYTEATKASPFQILNEVDIGLTGSRTSVNCSALVPPITNMVIALIEINTPTGSANVFWSGSGGARDMFIMSLPGTGMISSTVYDLELVLGTSTGQIFSSASVDEDLSFYVLGYIDICLGRLPYVPT